MVTDCPPIGSMRRQTRSRRGSGAASRLAGKVALVTGASGGIGQAISRRLANEGASILVHYNSRREPAEALVSELTKSGHAALAAPADLSQADHVAKIFMVATEHLGASIL